MITFFPYGSSIDQFRIIDIDTLLFYGGQNKTSKGHLSFE
tara:strand:+ start:237 stop:356 length:120 start_codon:yes stop_codon:yes gene_type:complete